jgi:glycosyltransferase involved in cell wall biosynthesis
MASQTMLPERWLIVDTGSSDGTPALAADLARRHAWIEGLGNGETDGPMRGGPIVRAFEAGVARIDADGLPDVVVKLDADLELDPDYFERLLAAFAADPSLGIASGVCTELQEGSWVPLYGTRDHVWGAARSYRRECLQTVFPLEQRQGWDEIDAIKARLRGWRTATLFDLPFRHVRSEGERDGQRRRWVDKGQSAHYMGYRPSYMLLRTVYRSVREPSAVLMLWGFLDASVRHKPRLPDEEARAYLRDEQRLRKIGLRAREARGPAVRSSADLDVV